MRCRITSAPRPSGGGASLTVKSLVFLSCAGLLSCMGVLASACKEEPQAVQLPSSGTDFRDDSGPEDPTGDTDGDSSGQPSLADSSLLSLPPGWPSATIVAAANLDGQGDDEILCWNDGRLTIWHQGEEHPYETFLPPGPIEESIAGAPNVMTAADLDGDGREDLLVAYGMTRDHPDVPIQLAILQIKGESGQHRRVARILYEATSSRPQTVSLLTANFEGDDRPEILIAHYDSKYFVTAHLLFLGRRVNPLELPLRSKKFARVRMGTSWAVGRMRQKGGLDLFVGRPYGEKKLQPGDIFRLEGEKREKIPSHLGVRSVAFGDGDGDKRSEVYFGDGWHYDYGRQARGRLSVSRREPHGWSTHLIQETPGQYEIRRIQILDVDGDGRDEILTAGNRYISLFWHTEDGWMTSRISSGDDFVVATVRGRDHIVIPGNPVRVVTLEDLKSKGRPTTWSHDDGLRNHL